MTKLNFCLMILGMLALAGCSSKPVETAKAPSSDVVDAASTHKEPVQINQKLVYDGGKFEEGFDPLKTGGRSGTAIPTEKFYGVDRQKFAPVGKVLYVLTDEKPKRCILGRFTMVDGQKRLVAYSKSTVPTNYCIYQKGFNQDGQGFSLFINDGGICKPSYAEVTTDDQKRKLATIEEVDNTVSMSNCVEGTVSYGAELQKGGSKR